MTFSGFIKSISLFVLSSKLFSLVNNITPSQEFAKTVPGNASINFFEFTRITAFLFSIFLEILMAVKYLLPPDILSKLIPSAFTSIPAIARIDNDIVIAFIIRFFILHLISK